MQAHQDHRAYMRFTTKARLDKSINSLVGLVEGISVDSKINRQELDFLNLWLSDHQEVKQLHPYNELYPVVLQAVSDGVLTSEEKEDILWLCERLSSQTYYDQVTADMQRLHAVLAGIASDGQITEEELRGLSNWLLEHDHLRRCWPYDEVDALITSALRDKRIDQHEHEELIRFFSEFVAVLDDRTISRPKAFEGGSLVGVCAATPEIVFQGHTYCFTGASTKYTRDEFSRVVIQLGGQVLESVSPRLNYLVIGAGGNPCWAYACYGRKVEKAVELRKKGVKLVLVHEHDFHDAVADLL